MTVLWYCHKRGKEVRLEKEASQKLEDEDRVEELPDDPALPAPSGSKSPEITVTSDTETSGPSLPPPPVGQPRRTRALWF